MGTLTTGILSLIPKNATAATVKSFERMKDTFEQLSSMVNTLKKTGKKEQANNIIKEELNKIYTNPEFTKVPDLNRIVKLVAQKSNLVKRKAIDNNIAPNLNSDAKKNFYSIEERFAESSKKKIKRSQINQKTADQRKLEQTKTQYNKEGGVKDQFSKVKKYMEENPSVNVKQAFTWYVKNFTNRNAPSRKDIFTADIWSPNSNNSKWNKFKIYMKESDGEEGKNLFKFFDTEINNFVEQKKTFDKIKAFENASDKKSVQKALRPKLRKRDIDNNPYLRSVQDLPPKMQKFFNEGKLGKTESDTLINYLNKEHSMPKSLANRLLENKDYNLLKQYVYPEGISTSFRNKTVKKDYLDPVMINLLRKKEEAVNQLKNSFSFQVQPNAGPVADDIINLTKLENEIQNISKVYEDLGLQFSYPQISKGSPTKVKSYGKLYPNVLSLKKSVGSNPETDARVTDSYLEKLKEGKFKEIREEFNFKKGGLLDIEEMLESD